jgi:hypothetical protein
VMARPRWRSLAYSSVAAVRPAWVAAGASASMR